MESTEANNPSTGTFKVSQSRLLSRLFLSGHGLWSVGISAVACIILLILGFTVDIRYAILAFMLLLTVLPIANGLLYFFHGLKPVTVLNGLEHEIAISTTGIEVTIYPKYTDQEYEEPRVIARTFPACKAMKYSAGSNEITLWPAGNKYGFLIIPYNVFGSPEELSQWLDALRRLTDKKNIVPLH